MHGCLLSLHATCTAYVRRRRWTVWRRRVHAGCMQGVDPVLSGENTLYAACMSMVKYAECEGRITCDQQKRFNCISRNNVTWHTLQSTEISSRKSQEIDTIWSTTKIFQSNWLNLTKFHTLLLPILSGDHSRLGQSMESPSKKNPWGLLLKDFYGPDGPLSANQQSQSTEKMNLVTFKN